MIRRSVLRTLQRDAHLLSRAAGDAEAFRTGGVPRLARRLARREITRRAFQLFRRL